MLGRTLIILILSLSGIHATWQGSSDAFYVQNDSREEIFVSLVLEGINEEKPYEMLLKPEYPLLIFLESRFFGCQKVTIKALNIKINSRKYDLTSLVEPVFERKNCIWKIHITPKLIENLQR